MRDPSPRAAGTLTASHLCRQGLAMVLACTLLGGDVSAQLLSRLLKPVKTIVQPVVTIVTHLTCSVTQLLASPKLDSAVKNWASDAGPGTLRVIVTAEPGLLSTITTLVTTTLGLPLVRELPGINALVTEIDLDDLSILACDVSVSSISVDAIVRLPSEPASSGSAYSLRETLGLPDGAPKGTGIGVAVVDSGIALSPDFGLRITAFYDFTRGGVAALPSDPYGHGTHVAGLIAGAGLLAGGGAYRGVAPGAHLIGLRVLDEEGTGRTSDVISAIEYATNHRTALDIDVINLSLGHPIFEGAATDPLVRAVEAAVRAGIVVVAAGGNYGVHPDTGAAGYGGTTSPGNAPSVMTVGALDTRNTTTRGDDRIGAYSSRGPTWYDGIAKPDLVAPGHGMVSNAAIGSTLYERYPSARVSTTYFRLNGTSMAAAVASGAAALVLEANHGASPGAPPLMPNAVKAVLQYTALRTQDAAGLEYDHLTQGAGGLNAAGSLDVARLIDTTRPVTSYWWTGLVEPVTTIAGETWSWSQRILWGSWLVWGSPIDTYEEAWTQSTMWGVDHIVWGSTVTGWDDVVWGSPETPWASQIVWGDELVGTWYSDHIVWGSADDPATTAWGSLAEDEAGEGASGAGS